MGNPWRHLKNRFHSSIQPRRDSPDELLGELFQDVQIRRVFPDSMTFVDMLPAHTLRRILKVYRKERDQPHFQLNEFVEKYFRGILENQRFLISAASILWSYLRRP